MKFKIHTLILLFSSVFCQAQEQFFSSQPYDINDYVKGTLVHPDSVDQEGTPLVIILQGSGPTDRNGNQSFLKNDALKKLAHGLAENGIASYRYDKRIFQMQRLGIQERDIRFDHFIEDAISVLKHFKEDDRYSKLIILGHSQGSLVGMLAAPDLADGFISIGGLAQPIDSILTQQIAVQMPGLEENARQAFTEIRESGSTTNYNSVLESIFRPSVQPFILSWMKYDPSLEIKKLDIPILIINGSNDLQVSTTEAELLKEAHPKAELVILENMNHILRKIEGDGLVNSKSYNEPAQPLHPDLINHLVHFIESLK